MRTLAQVPEKARKHFDLYDMIGVYHQPGTKDELGKTIGATGWVDGGDSSHFVGIYHYCYALDAEVRRSPEYYGNMIGRLYAAAGNLKCGGLFGGFKRHPDAKYWYADCNRMSRDQATPLLAAMALSGARQPMAAEFKRFLLRGLLFSTNTRRNGTTKANHGQVFKTDVQPLSRKDQFILKHRVPVLNVQDGYRNYNWKIPDPMLFDIWAIYIRAFNWKLLYPVLLLADLQTYLNARLLLRNMGTAKVDTDVANFFIKYSLSRRKLPTFIGRWTDKLLPRLGLSARISLRYSAPGMPLFLGNLLAQAMENFVKKLKQERV